LAFLERVDPELVKIVARWQGLPRSLRVAVMAIFNAGSDPESANT